MSLDPANLTPGQVDGYAEHAFTAGGCAALAIALHRQTGWPIAMVTDAHNVYDDHVAGGGSALHWFVLAPDGRAIDVDGAHSPDELVEAYGGDADDGEADWGISAEADALDWYVEAQGEPIPISLAATFANPVLERAEVVS